MHRSKRPLVAASTGAALIAVAVVLPTGATAGRSTDAGAGRTMHLVERGGSLKIVDNPPKARHQYDFSVGDIVMVSRDVFQAGGTRAGSLQLVCIATTPTTQQCTGTETLPGGTLELAGLSAPAPSTTVAVIGGTGLYRGARGSSISTDRKSGGDIADQIVTLVR